MVLPDFPLKNTRLPLPPDLTRYEEVERLRTRNKTRNLESQDHQRVCASVRRTFESVGISLSRHTETNLCSFSQRPAGGAKGSIVLQKLR